jgi:amino acid adenylation domain-containing protein
LFTSGSTGEAKAALVSHGGMANHLQAKIDVLGLGNGDCIAQTAEHGFDISLWQYLAPLAVGGSVRVLDDATTHDPKALFVEADRAGVTVLELVPSMLRAGLEQLIRQGGRVPFARLRWLISTGEALAADLCRRWIALYPRVPVVNAYGPTECSDDVTHHIAEWAPPPDAPWAPIGRPIRGAVLHVVDACGNPVPPGTPGELLVGGACVGLGYRGDPVRSAAAFVPDRFSGAVGATLYRTGDLVRYRADGALDYLGRIDQQLKIGGVRIEPGEIEAALLQDPALLHAHVTTRARADGTPALVGYVVMRPGKSVDAGTLKAVARNVLPPVLVPNAFVFLDALPLTANGKIDTAALPEPDLRPRPRIPVPPTTPVETALVRIWSEAIGQSGFGVQDDFFDLGGRSLDASCIARRIEDEFNIRFPMVEIFRAPTVRDIARFVETRI